MRSLLLGSLMLAGSLHVAMAADNAVKVAVDESHQRVDVTIDGKPFTAYVWPSTLKKPVLFPLVAADGCANRRRSTVNRCLRTWTADSYE